jgi:hypothetical protein
VAFALAHHINGAGANYIFPLSAVEYFYQDDKRYHRTDGIIFTPNSAYIAHTNPQLFKWKYTDKCSIDFKLSTRFFLSFERNPPAVNAFG